MPLLMKLFHVITAFWFIAGLLGRTITMRQAARTSDVRMLATLVALAGRFENLMVIPGSMAVLGFGLVTAWLQGWPLLGASSNWLFISTLLVLSMIPIIILIFVPRGKIFGKALEDAQVQGIVTPQLQAAFADRYVTAAHVYELASTLVVIILMVAKPF
jgi:uncharacterized membrane protein